MIDEGHGDESYWAHPPNLNGLSSSELLRLPDPAFLHYMAASRAFRETIYGVSAARAMAWPRPSDVHDTALDFGCGVGYDAVSLAELGWRVSLCDRNRDNTKIASRWLHLLGLAPTEPGFLKPTRTWERFILPGLGAAALQGGFGLVLSYGVLHHIEDVEPVVRQLQTAVAPGGTLSLMLYTRTFVPEPNRRSDGKREGPYTRGYALHEIEELLGDGWRIERTETWNADKYRAVTAVRATP